MRGSVFLVQTVAVDMSIWLTQFLKAMRSEEGDAVPNAHLIGVFRRVCKVCACFRSLTVGVCTPCIRLLETWDVSFPVCSCCFIAFDPCSCSTVASPR